MLLSGMGVTITVLRMGGGENWRGDSVDGTGYVDDHDIDDVLIELDKSNQSTDFDGREDYRVSGTFTMDVGDDIQAGDRVQLPDSCGFHAGELVAVEGKPFNWQLGSWNPGKRVRFRGVGSNGSKR